MDWLLGHVVLVLPDFLGSIEMMVAGGDGHIQCLALGWLLCQSPRFGREDSGLPRAGEVEESGRR